MAVPVVQSRSEQKESSNTTTSTITAPAGIVDGDVLIICLATDGDQAGAITWPAGFTPIEELSNAVACFAGAAFKIASGEAGNYVVSWPDNEKAILEMYRIDGAVGGGEDIQDPGETNTGTAATATITPVAATDADDSLVIVVMGMDDDDITVDGGGDADYVVLDVDESDAAGGSCSIGVQSRDEAAAAVPPQCDLTLTASEQFAAFWFAVRSISPTFVPRPPVGGVALIGPLTI